MKIFNKGYVALSIAVIVGVVITSGILYLRNQGGIKSKHLVGNIQEDRQDGQLKEYVTRAAALLREEIFKGSDPRNPQGNEFFNPMTNDFKCMDNPDYKNPEHLFKEPNPPQGKKIVYTCKNQPLPSNGAMLTAYFEENGKVNDTQSAIAYLSYQVEVGMTVETRGIDIKRKNKLIPEIDALSPILADHQLTKIIYLFDYITTKDDQLLKIHLKDKTVLQIGPNSEFYFKKYHFKKVNERSTVYKLLKGTIQVLFGAKNENEDLIIETPTVAMGVRGTEYVLNVKDLPSAYHVTMDVISGEVNVFDKNNALIKTVKAGETFNHYQAKGQTSGINIDGNRRSIEESLYTPLPAHGALPSMIPFSQTYSTTEKFIKTSKLIETRSESLLLYGYLQNASREPAKKYFEHVRTGGWGGAFNRIRSGLINEPLFLSTKNQYSNMEFLSSYIPAKKNFNIALMSPTTNFDNTFNPQVDLALVFDYKDVNNAYLLIYPKEDLDSLAGRFSPGPYNTIDQNFIIAKLKNLELKNGDIWGCGTASNTNCENMGDLKLKLSPDDENQNRLIATVSGVKKLIKWNNTGIYTVDLNLPLGTPTPTPTPTATPCPSTCIRECNPDGHGHCCGRPGKGCLINCGSDPSCTGYDTCPHGDKGITCSP